MDIIISPSLLAAYIVCKRQAWLMSRNIISDQDDPYLTLGRVINEASYSKSKKEILIDNMKIDLVENNSEGILIVGEIKKSSKSIESAKAQLLFYLYNLRKIGIEAEGVLLFPTERKRQKISLNDEETKKIALLIKEIESFLKIDKPPKATKIPKCKKCSYKEFCWG